MPKASRIRIACIQLNAGAGWMKNLSALRKQLLQSLRNRPDWILLPENFIARAPDSAYAEITEQGVPVVLKELREFSKKYNLGIVAGSVSEKLSGTRKPANTCFVFLKGRKIFAYRKMHLFDVSIPGVKVTESKQITAGKEPGFFKAGSMKAGIGICYDIRFPEYFRTLSSRGMNVLFVPANFTAKTGKTAWEALLRARAIENQCYVIAAGQCGRHPGSGIVSYGNSMIIDPLGRVMKRASFGKAQILAARLDLNHLEALRRGLPVLKHRKIGPF